MDSREAKQWCEDNGIVYRAFLEASFAHKNISRALSTLKNSRVPTAELPEVTFRDVKCIKASLVAGLYPLVVKLQHPEVKYEKTASGASKVAPSLDDITLLTPRSPIQVYDAHTPLALRSDRDTFLDIQRVAIGPRSLNGKEGQLYSRFMCFYEKFAHGKQSQIGITSPVSAVPLLIAAAPHLESRVRPRGVHECLVDRWFVVDTAGQTAAHLRVLQALLQAALDQFVAEEYRGLAAPTTDHCVLPEDTSEARKLFEMLLQYSGVTSVD